MSAVDTKSSVCSIETYARIRPLLGNDSKLIDYSIDGNIYIFKHIFTYIICNVYIVCVVYVCVICGVDASMAVNV